VILPGRLLNGNEATAWSVEDRLEDVVYAMVVILEDNPVLHRIWLEWKNTDKELDDLTEEERVSICQKYQWIFKKQTKRFVDLESIYSSVHRRRNREEFQKWFYVVGGYILSRVHLGDCSYHNFKERFKKQFNRDRCTSDDFSQQVLLVLGILGYITDFGHWYRYNKGSSKNHGYHYVIDREKLELLSYTDDSASVSCCSPEWTQTSTIKFEEKGDDADKMSWSMHPDWLSERQYESICSVEVVQEGLQSTKWLFDYKEYQYYYNLSDEEQDNLMDDWYSYQKIRDLSCHIVGRCLDDSDKPDGKGYAGRFHTPMTNMRSEHRHKYLRLDGELITEVDVSNAQPSFLGLLVFRETNVRSEWLKQCLSGHFYEWIIEKTNSTEDRKTIKKWMMQYLYSCYQPNVKEDYGKPHHPTYENKKTDDPFLCFQQRLNQFLKKEEPAIYQKIEYCKRNPVFRKDKPVYKYYDDKDTGGKKKSKVRDGKWCSMLSFYLVEMEVEYIKNCIHSLPDDMKFWTIHDCICVKETDSEQVQSIMEDVSARMYGLGNILDLKRENTSEPS